MLPHRNFLDVNHDEEKIDAAFQGKLLPAVIWKSRFLLSLSDWLPGRHTAVKTADGRVRRGEGPEYETTVLMGPVCDVYDLDYIIQATIWPMSLGLDTVTFGGTVACAMELYEKGYLTPEQTDGLEIKFGRGDLLEKLVT